MVMVAHARCSRKSTQGTSEVDSKVYYRYLRDFVIRYIYTNTYIRTYLIFCGLRFAVCKTCAVARMQLIRIRTDHDIYIILAS